MSNIQMDYTFRMETADGTKFGPELEIVIFAELVGGAWELTQIEFEEGVYMIHSGIYSTEMRVVWNRVQDDLWNDDELNRRAWLAREEQNEGV